MRLVSFFGGVRIVKMVVVEIWRGPVIVEMPVIASWTSKIILDSKACIIVCKTRRVGMLIGWNRTLILGWNGLSGASPLDGWCNCVRVCLLFWVVHSDIVLFERLSIWIVTIPIIPEGCVLMYWDAMSLQAPVPVKIVIASVLVELSIGSSAPSFTGCLVEVGKDLVEVSLESAPGLDRRLPCRSTELSIEVFQDIISFAKSQLERGLDNRILDLDSLD